MTSAAVVKNGAPEADAVVPDQLSITEERRLHAHWKGTTSGQVLSFYKVSDKEFFASTNSLYDAYPIENKKSFVVPYGRDYLAFDNGTCEAIDTNGLVVPATCEFAQEGANKIFRAEYQFPRNRSLQKTKHVILGDVFVHESMFDASRFTRKK